VQVVQLAAYEPGGGLAQHRPMVHVPVHVRPQPPQFIGSLPTCASQPSFESVLQSSKPGWHAPGTQALATQARARWGPAVQTVMQLPQWLGSFLGSTQLWPVLQVRSGASHPALHWPSTHAVPAAQG